ncbi:MAG: Mut7-C RNAse domain-containing protein [Pelolinea sp.]|nr:Mut7-C RNAse domain-containing protein [Pelolinea sp.]
MIIKQASFRFYAELNDFLKPSDRFQDITVPFKGRQTVKHLVESLGVPHPEIDLILANGQSVGFEYLVQDNDRMSIYPVFESFNIAPAAHLRPRPLRNTRFILDGHLGKLASHLWMLGFDATYMNDCVDDILADISQSETRILLTRDRGLLKRKQVTRGYCLRSLDPYQQLLEIMRRFDLKESLQPFTRCMACGGLLYDVDKSSIYQMLQPLTRKYFNSFKQCTDCGRVFWSGSHSQHMQRLIDQLYFDLD